jgi:hypothetical protein
LDAGAIPAVTRVPLSILVQPKPSRMLTKVRRCSKTQG